MARDFGTHESDPKDRHGPRLDDRSSTPSVRDLANPSAGMQRVEIAGVVSDPMGGEVVLLYHAGSERIVPIGIGEREATTIALRLSGQRFPRPLTHDLLDTILRQLGATIVRVEIDTLEESTFFAHLIVRDEASHLHEIDARPSDCLALAAGSDIGVYVAEGVLDHAGMPADGSTAPGPSSPPPTTQRSIQYHGAR